MTPTTLVNDVEAAAQEAADGMKHAVADHKCPVVPGLRRGDWALPDPEDQPTERVRESRDEIRNRV